MQKTTKWLGALQLLVATVLASNASAQSQMEHPTPAVAPSPTTTAAQQSFTLLKSLAGTWEGAMTMPPGYKGPALPLTRVSMRITSRGNALVHEMQGAGQSDDPTKYDHPLTMLYVDGGNLNLIHYCDAGNRPHMVARTSADGKTVEFDFVDLTGPTNHGHMHHAVFTLIDANHHTEEWTYMMPGDKPMSARANLTRVADVAAGAGK